ITHRTAAWPSQVRWRPRRRRGRLLESSGRFRSIFRNYHHNYVQIKGRVPSEAISTHCKAFSPLPPLIEAHALFPIEGNSPFVRSVTITTATFVAVLELRITEHKERQVSMDQKGDLLTIRKAGLQCSKLCRINGTHGIWGYESRTGINRGM